MDEFTKPDNKSAQGEGGIATLEAPTEPDQPQVSLNDNIHPDQAREPEGATSQAPDALDENGNPVYYSQGEQSAEAAQPDLQLTAVPERLREEALETGIDPSTSLDELFGDEEFSGIAGVKHEHRQPASKGKVLAVATGDRSKVETALEPDVVSQTEFGLSMINELKIQHDRTAVTNASAGARAAIEDKAIDALFVPESSIRGYLKEAERRDPLVKNAVEAQLGIGQHATLPTLDPDLAQVRALAASQMPTHVGKLDIHEFPSMGHSSAPDMTIAADRAVMRMKATIFSEMAEAGRAVKIASSGARISPVLSPAEVAERVQGPEWKRYESLKAEALAA